MLIEHFGSYLSNFFLAGYYGVDLFFVISGFLITSILLKDQTRTFTASYKNFIGRRCLRIFPIYYLTILILVIADFPTAREMWLWLATYTFNYGVILNLQDGLDAPLYYLWSLSVEEQFYLFWPLLVIFFRERIGALFGITLMVVLISYSQITFNLVPALSPFNETGLPNRIGSLGLGALGAIYVAWKRLPDWFFQNAWVEGVILVLLLYSITVEFQLRFVAMGICSLYLVLKASLYEFNFRTIDQLLLNRVMIYVGSISYGIYLFHIPLGTWMTQYVFDPVWLAVPWDNWESVAGVRWHSWLLKLPLYSLITIGLAALSYRFVESPLLSLKDRWFKYSSGVEAATKHAN